jgi:hypothetical protein
MFAPKMIKITRMKTLILIALTTVVAMGQADKPFKGSNTIVFKTGLTNDEAFDAVCKRLVSHAYSIETLTKEFYQVRTGIKPVENVTNYLLIVNVEDGRIRIRPLIKDEKLGIYEWTYKGSWMYAEYDVHKQILKHFSDLGDLVYEKK